MRKAVFALMTALLLVTGCTGGIGGAADTDAAVSAPETADSPPAVSVRATSAQASSAPSGTPSSTVPTITVPAGYYTEIEGFGYRSLGDTAVCPDSVPKCIALEIFSAADCPAGATVNVEYYRESVPPVSDKLGDASAATPPITAGGTQQIFLSIPAEIADIPPYGYVQNIAC